MTGLREATRRFSNQARQRFGKPGRPTRDAVAERLRIYRVAGPLILSRGVRGTTIRDVAKGCFLSAGGIYHYFSSKADLVLYGLAPEALSRACKDAAQHLASSLPAAVRDDPHVVVGLFVERNVMMLEFVRPALHAAIELGRPELQTRLAPGLREDADALISSLRSLLPGSVVRAEAADTLRRTILGLALDETVSAAEAKRQLTWLTTRILPMGDGCASTLP